MWTVIGRIVAPHGVQGEVRVYPDSDFPERFLTPGLRWWRSPSQPEPQPLHLLAGRYVAGKGLYVLRFEEVTDRQRAEALRQVELVVPASDRPPLDPGEFYVQDLVGLKVRLQGSETAIGTVVDVFAAGNDLLAVELFPPSGPVSPAPPPNAPQSRRWKAAAAPPRLVPFVEAIVPQVNLAEGWVEVTPPPGLLD
jgi:16S rRNA processing protein RimM